MGSTVKDLGLTRKQIDPTVRAPFETPARVASGRSFACYGQVHCLPEAIRCPAPSSRGLSEALHAELSPIGVRVTVVEHRLLPNRLP
jgi:hypothetical protein